MSADLWVWAEKFIESFAFCVLRKPELLSNHEGQLSCPASWCDRGSDAVSGLLWHQMAVSILSFRGVVLPFLHNAVLSRSVKTDDIMKIHHTALCCMFHRGEGSWQLWNGPQHSCSVSDGGGGGTLSMCGDECSSVWNYASNYFVLLIVMWPK